MPKPFTFVALLFLFVSLPAAAHVYDVPPDEAMVDEAPFIVYGEVEQLMPAPDAGFTDALVRVEAQLKGRAVDSVITVRQPGGRVGDVMKVISGLASLAPGQRVLLFLEPADDDAFRTVGWDLGMFFERGGVLSRYGVHGDPPRRSAPFREWVSDRVVGVDRPVDYSAPSSGTTDGPQSVTSPYTLFTAHSCRVPGSFLRWTNFDDGGSATVTIHGTQPEIGVATTTAIRKAIRAWSSVPGSTVSLNETSSTESFPVGYPSGSDVRIGFDDPHDELPTRIIAAAYRRYRCEVGSHAIPGSAAGAFGLTGSRIVTNELLAQRLRNDWRNPLNRFIYVMGHELGHVLGVGHPCDGGECSSDEEVAVMNPWSNGGRWIGLGVDDEQAIRFLYPARQVSVTPSAAVTEGGAATFTFRMSHDAPSATTVNLTIGQTGDFVAAGQLGERMVTVPAGGQVTYTVPTLDDSNDEVAGTVTATVRAGPGYTVPAVLSLESVPVHDNDDPSSGTPIVSITGGAAVFEGTDAIFTIRANPAPAADLPVKLVISQTGDFVEADDLGEKTVTVPTTGEVTHTVPTVDDDAVEDRGMVTATLVLDTGYGLHNMDSSAVHVEVEDPDRLALPVSASVSGRALAVVFSRNLDDASVPAGSAFTVTATPPGESGRSIIGTGPVGILANTATVPLAGSVAHGEALTVNYTKPSRRRLQNEDLTDEVAGFTGLEATNLSSPAPAGTLVSNTGQTPGPSQGLSAHLASSFITGGYGLGSRLTSVDIPIVARPTSEVVANVDIVAATSGRPGSTVLATLTPPSNLVVGFNRFTAPGAQGVGLAGGRRYFVVLRFEGANTDDWKVGSAGAIGEDPGNAPGWKVAPVSYSRAPQSTDWVSLGRGSALTIAVNGYAVRSKVLASNTGQASAADSTDASFGNDHGQPFTTGGNNSGYRVTSVEVETDIDTPGNSTEPTYTVSIRSDSSGDPGSEGDELVNPSALAAGTNTFFTALYPGIKLDRRTKYFLLVDVSAAGDRGVSVVRTDSDAEDARAAAGWSIGNKYRRKGNTATTWSDDSSAIKVTVRGHGVGPLFERAEVIGNLLIIIFDGHVKANSVTPAVFDVIATNPNGESRVIGGIGQVVASRNELNVQLALEVAADETVTVSYTPPASQRTLRDGSGNWVDGFSDQPVTNLLQGNQ